MKSEELLRHIGSVDDKYIEELFTDSANTANSQRRKPKWALIAACFAVALLGSIAAFGGHSDESVAAPVATPRDMNAAVIMKNSVIMIDVNPAISLEVDPKGNVVGISAGNEEAEALLDGLELTDENYSNAVSDVIDALKENGYLSQKKNSVLITVVNEDKSIADTVRHKAVASAIKNNSVDYELSVLSQIMTSDKKYAESAEKYGISTGRMWLIKKTNDMNEGFAIDNLVAETVHTLNQLYDYTGLPKLVQRVGSAAGTAPKDYIEKMGVSELSPKEIVGVVKEFSDFYDSWDGDDADSVVENAYKSAASKTSDAEEISYIVLESLNILTKAGERISNAVSDGAANTATQNNEQPAATSEPLITADDVKEIAEFVVQIVEYFD